MTAASPAAEAWRAEQHRLTGIAYRMLGDYGLAEDVVSEVALAAVRAERTGGAEVRSWPAWLTTVCVRRSIDQLRELAAERESYPGPWLPEPVATDRLPEDVVADRELLSIGLLHLAEQLSPQARAALVLHRGFRMTSAEIGTVLERSPAAVRQLVSRAERRLQIDDAPPVRSAAAAQTLSAMVTAIERGEVATLVHLFAEDAVLWTDGGGTIRAARNPIYGADRIIRFYTGVFTAAITQRPDAVRARIVHINGEPGLDVRTLDRRDLVALDLDPAGQVRGVRQIANPDKLTRVPV